jgi:hypothetical protein
MPFVFKARKTELIAALSSKEQALADKIARLMEAAGQSVDWDAIAEMLQTLDPNALNGVIRSLRVQAASTEFQDALKEKIIEIIDEAAKGQSKIINQVVNEALPQLFGNDNLIVKPPEPEIKFSFNSTELNAQRWAEMRAGQLVTSIDNSTEESIRKIVHQGFVEQRSGDDIARRVRNIVGLHPRWALAVDRFSTREYERLRKAGLNHADARRLSQENTEKYRQKLIRARAKMIARTEVMTASNTGRQLAWQQGVDAGYVDPISQKRWSTSNTLSGGPCDLCAPMKGETVRIDSPFSNGLMSPPTHPNCRCTVVLVPPSRGITGLPSQDMASVLAELGSTNEDVPS